MANANPEKYQSIEYPKEKCPGALKHLLKQHAETRGKAIAEGKKCMTPERKNAEENFKLGK